MALADSSKLAPARLSIRIKFLDTIMDSAFAHITHSGPSSPSREYLTVELSDEDICDYYLNIVDRVRVLLLLVYIMQDVFNHHI